MRGAALNSHENRIERMAEAGTAAAVIAFLTAAFRATTTAVIGPYPELFVGITGGIWWGLFGSCIAIALGATFAVTVMLLRQER